MSFRIQEGVRSGLVGYTGSDFWPNALLHKTESNLDRRLGIVTLHGSHGHAMSGINVWLAPYLATKGYTVLSPNKRNSGSLFDSSVFDDCENDIKLALDFLDKHERIKRVVLIGHSMGASEAIFYAAKTQDTRVRGLAIMGAAYWYRNILDRKKWLAAARAQRGKDAWMVEGRLLGRARKSKWARIISYSSRWGAETAKHYLSCWAPGSNNDSRIWIGKVTVPLLNVIHEKPLGSICREKGMKMLSSLATSSPTVSTTVIRGADHTFRGHFEDVETRVADWLISIL